jgi:signal transduction histidine kinase
VAEGLPERDLHARLAAAERLLAEREAEARRQAERLETLTNELRQRAGEAEEAQREAERYAERMRFLAEAGQTLAASLDYETTLRRIADLAVPAAADWCVIDLVEEGTLRRIAVAHPDPAMVELVAELHRRYPEDPDSPHGVHEVVRTGRPLLVPRIDPELIAGIAQDAGHRRTIESLNLGSYLIVPLRAVDSTIGTLTLVRAADSGAYDEDDLAVADELAARAGLAIENARLVGSLEQSQRNLEQTATELERQAEELQSAIGDLESTTHDLLQANEELDAANRVAEQARRAAEEANAAKSQFLATMSHELRTPLNAIDGYAELLELGIHGPVTAQQREALRRLRRAQKRLLSLVNDVLNFAKLESGQVVFRYRKVRIVDVLRDVEGMVMPQIAEKNQTLAISADNPDIEVWADRHKVSQILLKLLANAVKFTGEGGQIRVAAGIQGSMASISVADTGDGIPPERLNLIFEPFVQAQGGMIRDQGGVGLGLAIGRDLAQRMNGELRVQSQVGVGSTFTLLLPLSPDGDDGTGHGSMQDGSATGRRSMDDDSGGDAMD